MTSVYRNLEVMGSIFWILASGLVTLAIINYGVRTGFYAGQTLSYGYTEVAIAGFYFILVYPCLMRKSWGFVASMALSAFVVLATFAIEGPADPIDDLYIIMGLLSIYFSYAGYLKVRIPSRLRSTQLDGR